MEEWGGGGCCEIEEVASPLFPVAPVVGAEYRLPCPLELLLTRSSSGGSSSKDLLISAPAIAAHFISQRLPPNTRNLLNSAAVPLLSACRKSCSFLNRWDVFRGDEKNNECALFSVKRASYFQMKTSLHVFLASNIKEDKPDFKVKGDFDQRTCVILHDKTEIAVIKPKDNPAHGPAWKIPFVISVSEGIDHAFIIALAVILDEMHLQQLESRGVIMDQMKV